MLSLSEAEEGGLLVFRPTDQMMSEQQNIPEHKLSSSTRLNVVAQKAMEARIMKYRAGD